MREALGNEGLNEAGIDCRQFRLGEAGLTNAQLERAMGQAHDYLHYHHEHAIGYQMNQKLDYLWDLGKYLNICINNVGDPFQPGNNMVNTKWIERAVLDYYAQLWHAGEPHVNDYDRFTPEEIGDTYWGYVVSMGSTESNLYALRNARDYLSGKMLASDLALAQRNRKAADADEWPSVPESKPTAYRPVLFYSQDTHYSIDKIKDLLLIETFSELGNSLYPGMCPIQQGQWPDKVPSNPDGSIHIESLVKLVEFFAKKGHPIIVNFNYGTTFKGCYDRVQEAIDQLVPVLKENQLYRRVLEVNVNGRSVRSVRNGFWFHVDGALGASYMPFLEKAVQQGRLQAEIPVFDFRTEIQSLSMSVHKAIGSPWPSGIYMSKTKYLLNFSSIDYIGAQDSTLSGSRNGLSALILWTYLAKHSYEDQIRIALEMAEKTNYAYWKLKDLEERIGANLYVERSPLALTIRFQTPSPHLVAKYSLSTEQEGDIQYAHIYLMEHVSYELIDEFVRELGEAGAFEHLERTAELCDEYACLVLEEVGQAQLMNEHEQALSR